MRLANHKINKNADMVLGGKWRRTLGKLTSGVTFLAIGTSRGRFLVIMMMVGL
jgi:hypothetical protein